MSVLINIGREIDGDSHFTLRQTLEEVTYTLHFRWNVRGGSWFVSAFNADETIPYRCGMRVGANQLITLRGVNGGPPGEFVVYDTSGTGEDPDFDDLGNRISLYYLTVDELEA